MMRLAARSEWVVQAAVAKVVMARSPQPGLFRISQIIYSVEPVARAAMRLQQAQQPVRVALVEWDSMSHRELQRSLPMEIFKAAKAAQEELVLQMVAQVARAQPVEPVWPSQMAPLL